jgi:hypothetical protein
MKKALLWIVGIIVGVTLGLALIGYIAGPQKKTVKEVAQPKPQNNLERLNAILERSDLSLCEVYDWIGTMESQTRQEIELKNPAMNVADRTEYIEKLRDLKWLGYCAQHNLPDSVRAAINGYGLEHCQE